jgi:hypothetical protein
MSTKPNKVEVAAPRMLSYKDAALYLGIAVQTLRNKTSRRAKNALPFKPKRLAGKPLFDRLELDRFCDSLQSEGNDDAGAET